MLTIALEDDGKTIIGGYFSSVNGVTRTNIARLNADGSVDQTWNPGANDAVRQIVVSGTDVFVLGDFTIVGGQNRNGIAKLSTAGPGAADPLWNPNQPGNLHAIAVSGTNLFAGGLSYLGKLSTTGGGAGESPWGPQPDYNIFALALHNGDLFAAGNFSNIGGAVRSRLARLSTLGTGKVDPAWDPNATGGNLGVIYALVATNSYLYVGGSFDQIGGQSRKNIARVGLDGSGAADPVWDPGSDHEAVYALAVNGGDVFAGGSFSQIGGLPRGGLAKLSASSGGAADPSWIAETQGGLVAALAVRDGSVFVGGGFATINDVVSLSVGQLNALTGARDDSFSAQVGYPGTPLAVARQADGKVIVGGDFYLAGGLTCRNLARFDVDGMLDLTWRPNPDGRVTAMLTEGSDIFIAGAFTKIGGLSRNFLAKLSARGTGEADAAWNPNPSVPVDALALEATNLFVASSGFDGATIVKLTTTGAGQADADWDPGYFECLFCQTSDPIVSSLVADSDGVYVAGQFDTIHLGANSIARRGLAKVSATGPGLPDGQWDPSPDGAVNALALDHTNLYVAGSLHNIGGQNRIGLARVSTTGTGLADAAWGSDLSAGYVDVLALSGTNLYAGGSITTARGSSNAPLARLSATGSGTVDPTWNPRPIKSDSTDGHVVGLAAHGTDVYVVGDFDSVGEAARYGFAFLPVADAPRIIQDSASLMIFRNPNDGLEISHFRITGLDGVSLFQSDGVTPLNVNEFISVAQGASGLRYTGAGTVTVVSALNDTPAGAGTASTTVNLGASPAPLFTSATFSSEGEFRFAFSGLPKARCIIEVSADLLRWIPLSTNAMDINGYLEFTDPTSLQAVQRFYRIHQSGP